MPWKVRLCHWDQAERKIRVISIFRNIPGSGDKFTAIHMSEGDVVGVKVSITKLSDLDTVPWRTIPLFIPKKKVLTPYSMMLWSDPCVEF